MWWLWARLSDRSFDTAGHAYPPFVARGYDACFAQGTWGDDVPLDDLIEIGLESDAFAGVIFAWPALRDAPYPVRADVFGRPVPLEIHGPDDVPGALVDAGLFAAIAARTERLRREGRQSVLYCGMPHPSGGVRRWSDPLKTMGWPWVWLDSAGAVATARSWFRALARACPVYGQPGACGIEPIPEVHGLLGRLVASARYVAVQSGVMSGPQPWPYTPFAPGDARVRLHGPGYYGLACHRVWHRVVLVFTPSQADLAITWHETGSVDVAIWPQDVASWRRMLGTPSHKPAL